MILKRLTEEILFEANQQSEAPNWCYEQILNLRSTDSFLFELYSFNTLWTATSELDTAGVSLTIKDGKSYVDFAYNPKFVNGLSEAGIYFLLAHEAFHILQNHHASSAALGKSRNIQVDHKLANYAMDTWINTELFNDGQVGGHPVMAEFPGKPGSCGFAFRKKDPWGDVERWLNQLVEKATGVNPGEKYEGVEVWDALYDWINEMFDKYNIRPEPEDGEEEEPEEKDIFPNPGDIIRGPNGEYGQVIEIDEVSRKVTKVRRLTQDEAYALA